MPDLSALEVCSQRGAIQIHVYLLSRIIPHTYEAGLRPALRPLYPVS